MKTERLTERFDIAGGTIYKIKLPRFVKEYISVDDKLGRFEDIEEKHDMSIDEMDAYITEHKKIEEELGIELNVFVKAHKGVYYKNRFNEICYCEHPIFEFCQAPADMKWHMFVYGAEELKISRYGKTWALTKEELEK